MAQAHASRMMMPQENLIDYTIKGLIADGVAQGLMQAREMPERYVEYYQQKLEELNDE